MLNAKIRSLQSLTGASEERCIATLKACAGDLELAHSRLADLAGDDSVWLRRQFLIAMPALDDDNFSQTVSLMCEHSDQGAVGLIINRPLQLDLATMLEQMGIEHPQLGSNPSVFWGGPVQPERGFVVHGAPGGWDSSLELGPELFVTTSRDVLTAIGSGNGPRDFLVVLGYAGWGAGQLETEILSNSWLSTAASPELLFRTEPARRWQAATRLLGVDITRLSSGAGHG